jgi:hypothetical protein
MVEGRVWVFVVMLGFLPEHPQERLVLVFLPKWFPKISINPSPYLRSEFRIFLGIGKRVPVLLDRLEGGTFLHLLNFLEGVNALLKLRVGKIYIFLLHVLDINVFNFVVNFFRGKVLEALVNLIDGDDVGLFWQFYFFILEVYGLLLFFNVDADQLALRDYHLFLCGLQFDCELSCGLCGGVTHH